jgi:hypothetical protein
MIPMCFFMMLGLVDIIPFARAMPRTRKFRAYFTKTNNGKELTPLCWNNPYAQDLMP